MMLDVTLFPFLAALIVTVLLTPLTLPFIRKIGLVDDPQRQNHPGIIHTKPIPRGGGIPLFLGVLIAGIFFLPVNKVTLAIFLASFLALVIGVIDDKFNARAKDVSPYLRFLINILCAVIVVGSGVTIPFITNPFGGILELDYILFPFLQITPGDIVAGLWIIWVMNMLNWSKGVDGQMPGIVAISAIVIGILSLRFPFVLSSSLIDAKLSFMLAGSAIGFLIFNFYPARIFPGYGATSIYLLLAVVSILSSAKLATAILVMGVPTVDALFTIGRRLFHRKSPFKGDNWHLHHLLLRLGYTQRQIALFYWTLSGILGTISLTLQSKSKLFALLMLVVLVGGALLFLHFSVRYSHEKDTS
jgi:UDP-GlcNAc:undecaprenyl-phosphate GlcNAc-1-phosphate transferase